MGSKKSGILEKIKEGQDIGKKAGDRGTEIIGESSEIKKLLDSMDRNVDEDDAATINEAEIGYIGDTGSAFKNEVEAKAEDAVQREMKASETAEAERSKVEGIKSGFERLEGISDIGKQNAEKGRDSMEQSVQEYESFMEQSEKIEEDVKASTNALRSQFDSIFGK